MRFQPGTFLCALIVLMGIGKIADGQETIKPQFLFGGEFKSQFQEPSVIGQFHPVQESMEIRPLPPSPPFSSPSNRSLRIPSLQPTGQPADIAHPSSPRFSAPSVPNLGYPGAPLPTDYSTFEGSSDSTPPHWGQPFESETLPETTRRPVVIPNEPSTEGQLFPVPATNHSNPDYPPTNPGFGPLPSEALTPYNSAVINEGFRRAQPTQRGAALDDYGQEFDFENKKREYPPFREIIKTGRYFGNAELLYLKPYFQNNTAITIEDGGSGSSQPFDFGYDTGNRFLLGFESKYGPGLELNYFQYDHQSRPSSFTASGSQVGETSTWMIGPSRWTRLQTANPGETLTAEHSLEVQNIGVSLFKDWQLPISRMGGGFGIQYVSIAQDLQAAVTDAGGNVLGQLSARHDFRAFGPKLEFKYYRPVGHTKLEMIGGLSGAVLFGNRDQFVSNSSTLDSSRIGADEFLMIIDVIGGVQYVHKYADKRSFYARMTLMSQAWMGGGTALVPQDDFGFRGVGFAVGFNR